MIAYATYLKYAVHIQRKPYVDENASSKHFRHYVPLRSVKEEEVILIMHLNFVQ